MRFRSFLPGLCVLAAACEGGVSGDITTAVRDTTMVHRGAEVSVRVVENDATAALPEWRVDPEPLVDIGGADGPEEQALYRVRETFLLADGRIAVGDGGSASIKLFDADGRYLGAYGRKGEGPGEFRDLLSVTRLTDDSLAVWDNRLRRVTVFASDGTLAREVHMARTEASPFGRVIGMLASGRLLMNALVGFGDAPPEGFLRSDLQMMIASPDGTTADTIAVMPGSAGYYVPFDNGFQVFVPPLQPTTEAIAAGDRILIADGAHQELRVFDDAGAPVQVVRWSGNRRPLTDDDIARARAALLEAGRRTESVDRMFTAIPWSAEMPAFRLIRIARDGSIWVEQYHARWEEVSPEWQVFDTDGILAARVVVPHRFIPEDIGDDYILGIERDELDVEHVRLYRLERTPQ